MMFDIKMSRRFSFLDISVGNRWVKNTLVNIKLKSKCLFYQRKIKYICRLIWNEDVAETDNGRYFRETCFGRDVSSHRSNS